MATRPNNSQILQRAAAGMIIAVLIPYGLGGLLLDWAPDWRFENHPVHAVVEGLGALIAIMIAGAQDEKIDLLLSDVVLLHGRNGLDLAEGISRKWADMKVLLMTGYAKVDELQDENGELGFPVIEKPFPEADLGRRIGKLLNIAAD